VLKIKYLWQFYLFRITAKYAKKNVKQNVNIKMLIIKECHVVDNCICCDICEGLCVCHVEIEDQIAKNNAMTVMDVYINFQKAGLTNFLGKYLSDAVEHGITLNIGTNGNYKDLSPDDESTENTKTSCSMSISPSTTIASIHIHPDGNTPPSASDVFSIAYTYPVRRTSFVCTQQDEIIYVLYIQDPTKLAAFKNYSKDQLKIKHEEYFRDIDKKCKYAWNINNDDKQMYALALMIADTDSGIVLLRYDNGTFRQKGIVKNRDEVNVAPYTFINFK
jgi:hypothetical protein